MNLIEFNKILLQPSQLESGEVEGLHDILKEYPYFQAAHYFYLNGLRQHRSFKYNDQLKKTAAYTTDRALLFDNIVIDDRSISAAPAAIIDEKPSAQKPEQVVETENTEAISIADKLPEEALKLGQPLQFNKDETYSFREWLQLSSFTPIERVEPSTEGDKISEGNQKKILKKDSSNMKLVDDFIASSPKINPSLQDSYTDIAQDSVRENESLMTETLAHVYVAQKKYEKAITAFTILSLKYPEKSSFFAHQIQAIKKLQEK